MTIYYTSSSASGGGAGSYADPWTLQEAFDSAVAGDEVRIINDGTYTPSAQLDIDTNKGASGSRIKFLGRNSADTAYEKATISASSLSSGYLVRFGFTSGAVNSYLQFEDIVFDGSYTNTDQFGTADSYYTRFVTFKRCVFKNSNRYTMSAGYYFQFYQCEFIDGTSLVSFVVRNSKFVNCLFRNIGGHFQANSSHIHGCVFIDVGRNYSDSANYSNCVFDGAGLQANAISDMSEVMFYVNCVFMNYTGTVLGSGYGLEDNSVSCSGNYFYNNGTNASFVLNETNITTGGDPLFVSTVSGSENYTPQSSSPLIGAGVPGTIPYSAYQDMVGYATIGAIAPQSGGGLLRVGLNGGM